LNDDDARIFVDVPEKMTPSQREMFIYDIGSAYRSDFSDLGESGVREPGER
jgi:hypothetical protein